MSDRPGDQSDGVLIWFNATKHHGYIRTEDGERLFVDESGFVEGHVPGERCRGTRVRFRREEATEEGVARAVGVEIPEHSVPRRARLRGR
jgi:cold shock CspA family protein